MPDVEGSEITPTTAKFDTTECCASFAIDKDLSTFTATNTIDGYGLLKIEYGRTYFFRKVLIYYIFFNDWFDPGLWCAQSVANFKACINHHSDVDVSVYQGDVKQKYCGTFSPTYALEQSDQIYTLVCNAVGDSLRFSKTSSDNLVVAEVVVSGADLGRFRLKYR